MILEKRWEKRGEKLSTKNHNFFFKNYLSSRKMFKGILFLEIKLFEEQQRDLKLEALREAMRVALEELAALQEERKLLNLESTQNLTGQTSNTTESQTNLSTDQPSLSTDDNTELLTAEKIIADELIAEKAVILEHEQKLKKLR